MKIRDIRYVTSASRLDEMPDTGWPEVAIIGRSNVGKSSLLNMLVRRKKLARISAKPGRTRTFNFYGADDSLFFVDVPGFGYAKVSKATRHQWRQQIERYLRDRSPLRLVLHLVDGRHPPGELDQTVMYLLESCGILKVIVLTKMDKLSGNGRAQSIRRVSRLLSERGMGTPVVASSARTGLGRAELLRRISRAKKIGVS
ncbi:MAG: ribosome biogenesis GTP-binding protein YihA/YsxC [Bacteroidota bacterium]|nr:ribosome biogenesis GTP-binding protein YihA/YsxC [Bacteroidota bacterium]MDE2957378.1 ribosome biogenesis GTP-binding protein YihA/YsxC [Bacteroidota bacterium]